MKITLQKKKIMLLNRYDPTGTFFIRQSYGNKVFAILKALSIAVYTTIQKEDVFGLKSLTFQKNEKIKLPPKKAFSFETDAMKVEYFIEWLKTQGNKVIFKGAKKVDDFWGNVYIESTYRKGMKDAFNYLKKEGLLPYQSMKGLTKKETTNFLDTSFNSPYSLQPVKILQERTFDYFAKLSTDMIEDVRTVLTQGLINGDSPIVIGRALSKTIESLGRTRGQAIARTEIIRAYAESSLNTYENLGTKEVKVLAEWSTSHDDKVCPLCAAKDGLIMTVEEAHGLIPYHTLCRCAWLPANVGESLEGAKMTEEAYDTVSSDDILESIETETD
jgi:SPP1 gp7 family putative phage head morphogenesis protein